ERPLKPLPNQQSIKKQSTLTSPLLSTLPLFSPPPPKHIPASVMNKMEDKRGVKIGPGFLRRGPRLLGRRERCRFRRPRVRTMSVGHPETTKSINGIRRRNNAGRRHLGPLPGSLAPQSSAHDN